MTKLFAALFLLAFIPLADKCTFNAPPQATGGGSFNQQLGASYEVA